MWALIVATILTLATEMAMIIVTNQIPEDEEDDQRYNKYLRVVDSLEGVAQCLYSTSHWIFAIEYFTVALYLPIIVDMHS